MKVLVADDHPLDRSMIQIALKKWGYEVIECADGEEALQALRQEDAPQIAILDWMMPGMSGPDICADIRYRSTDRYVYIILLTSKNQKADIIEGLESGADDYVVKPFDLPVLQARMQIGRRIIELENKLVEIQEQLRVQATRDYLTGLWNRAAIIDIMKREIARAYRQEQGLGVILGDIDHFKEINDTYGHEAGDAVLRETASRIEGAIRNFDAAGRYGGEEFLIITTDCDGAQTLKVAERIRLALAEKPAQIPDAAIQVTISLGVANWPITETTSPTELINAADRAMYKAKDEGRNQVIGDIGA